MKREIKFRAWDGEVMHPKWLWLTDSNGDVVPNTLSRKATVVMQYTGLKDKNGKDIYEGDVVDYRYVRPDEPFVLEVIFDAEKARFATRQVANGHVTDGSFLYSGRCDIIGNVYENSDLLK